ncbi:MAG: NAD-dependent epimerase/dehydratase family protein [Calditrichia bacterium]
MQTILGAGGAIGKALAKALPQYNEPVRLVSRHPKKVNPQDELFTADLTQPKEVAAAVENSKVVYLTAGLPYNIKIWRTQWPLIMGNVIDACKQQGARLVFFDNIYMYDPEHLSPMTEKTPQNPSSEKGKVRKQLAGMIMEEVQKGTLQALIARSADFYGPSISNTSIMSEMVIKNLAAGKKANWMGSADCRHSFTYVPDAGKATALLGNTGSAYGQVWHLPTAADPPTGREWIEKFAREMGAAAKFRVIPRALIRIMGVFMPVMREMVEMMYQYDRDYVFDSSKFEKEFDIKPTPYRQGIEEIVAADYPGLK